MNKSFLLISALAITLTVGLYALPKVMVNTKNNELKQPQTTSTQSPAQNSHQSDIPADKQVLIDKLRKQYGLATEKSDKLKTAEQLLKIFVEVNKFDSAAYYAEQMAGLDPNERSFVRTGDAYYGAFQFAIEPQKAELMGETSRKFYKKALDLNPNLLEAKTNMAMTYVSTPTPMQGILLLREVLDESPDFEPALFNLGVLSMQSKQFDKAIGRFKKILDKNPKNTKAQFYLGISLAETGKKEEAKTLLKLVQATEKDPAIQAAIKETLEKL
jgi:tetratricopeptide (TPR) repeat protein